MNRSILTVSMVFALALCGLGASQGGERMTFERLLILAAKPEAKAEIETAVDDERVDPVTRHAAEYVLRNWDSKYGYANDSPTAMTSVCPPAEQERVPTKATSIAMTVTVNANGHVAHIVFGTPLRSTKTRALLRSRIHKTLFLPARVNGQYVPADVHCMCLVDVF